MDASGGGDSSNTFGWAVLASPNTGLADDDVFYFGNAVGETGNSSTDAMVTTADETLVPAGTEVPVQLLHRNDLVAEPGF